MEKMDQRLSRGWPGQDPRAACMALTEAPPTLATRWCPHCVGLHRLGTFWGLTRRWVSQGARELGARRTLVTLGPACGSLGTTSLLRPEEAQGRAAEQAEGAQLKRQSWARTPRDRQADHSRPAGSHGLSWPPTVPSDVRRAGAVPEPGLDPKNSKERLPMLGLLGEAPALDRPAPARWPAESTKGSHGSQSHRVAGTGPGSVWACTGPRG